MRRHIRFINIEDKTLKDDNQKIIELIKNNKPFIISRLSDNATKTAVSLDKGENFTKFKNIITHDGIYYTDIKDLKFFGKKHNECLENSDLLASFKGINKEEEDYYFAKYEKLIKVWSRILEPFYILQENETPWSHFLINKKVLIINPFVKSFQKQIDKEWKMFEDKHIFLPDQQFVFYKAYNTLAGNHPHSSWLETFEIMKNDISKLDFDIALLGCGGYGLPLCNFIKMELKKSAIYIGGGLQLLFGVKGKRWENHPDIGKIIKDNGQFISPSGDEILNNNNSVEGGCYW